MENFGPSVLDPAGENTWEKNSRNQSASLMGSIKGFWFDRAVRRIQSVWRGAGHGRRDRAQQARSMARRL
jgi:hypothetical protein